MKLSDVKKEKRKIWGLIMGSGDKDADGNIYVRSLRRNCLWLKRR